MSFLLLLQPSTGPTVTTALNSGPIDLLVLVRGDDYFAADRRALDWVTSDDAMWPALTGATVTFIAKDRSTTLFEQVATITVATGAAKSVRVELTAADTLALPVGNFTYGLQAVLTSGRTVSLARGAIRVLRNYTP